MVWSADSLAGPNSGNMAANMLLAKPLAANALAAEFGYESTRNVKTPEKTRMTLEQVSRRQCNMLITTHPQPKKELPMIGTIQ